tara:strand:+ start:4470 stop:5540 length:1071 start_codon:yes stop_codon:yes gene_type:complete
MKSDTSAIIFCNIIDNYGDAGFCARFSRALLYYIKTVTVFTDKPSVFHKIIGEKNLTLMNSDDVVFRVFYYKDITLPIPLSKNYIIFELFETQVPINFLRTFQERSNVKRIMLDYLSTEKWNESFQGIQAPDARLFRSKDQDLLKFRKRYWFAPGISNKSGGLIWEDRISVDSRTRKKIRENVLSLRETKIYGNLHATAFYICDFSYEKFRFSFFSKLARDKTFVIWSPRTPIFCQTDFDIILQSMDLNIVRGEDSFISAHFAASSRWRVPFLWQPYLENDYYHKSKFFGWKNHFNHLTIDSYWNFAQALMARNFDKYQKLWPYFYRDWLELKDCMALDCRKITKNRSLLKTMLET